VEMGALWSGVLCSLSALPPKADIANHDRHVRFGSEADIAARPINVRYSPESRRWAAVFARPLWANFRHSAVRKKGELLREDRLRGGDGSRRGRPVERIWDTEQHRVCCSFPA